MQRNPLRAHVDRISCHLRYFDGSGVFAFEKVQVVGMYIVQCTEPVAFDANEN